MSPRSRPGSHLRVVTENERPAKEMPLWEWWGDYPDTLSRALAEVARHFDNQQRSDPDDG